MRSYRARAAALLSIGALAAALGAPRAAHAAPAEGCYDCIFGASNINMVAGHGRLSVGVSEVGDLTVLAWPNPSLYDQLLYLTDNDAEAHKKPHKGAHPGMGSYLGLLVTAGGKTELSWLRDAPWKSEQRYKDRDTAVPLTSFSHADWQLEVTLTDIVSPDVDVLTRHLRVQKGPASPVTAVALVVYENLSPTRSRIPQLPFADWVLDHRNDFLAAWDADADAILHYHPGDRSLLLDHYAILQGAAPIDWGPVGALMKQSAPNAQDVASFVGGIDTAYTAGTKAVAALVSTDPKPTSFQVGADATPFCSRVNRAVDNLIALPSQYPGVKIPVDPELMKLLKCEDRLSTIVAEQGWQHQPQDALKDLEDGALSGSAVAAAQTNGALITELTFDTDGVAEGSALFAFGASRQAARTALDTARGQNVAARLAASEKATRDALAGVRLPADDLGQRVVDVALRALVNIYVARVAENGAIVASIARQSPYYLDWPRDGAFFGAALDVAGKGDWVDQRLRWFATLQRDKPTLGDPLLNVDKPVDPVTGTKLFPAGAWEMNYYADGTLGGPTRFEIDNTALHIWSIAFHLAHTPRGPERQNAAKAYWPATKAAADLLVAWRDEATGLPAPANEDDNAAFTSTLHGASTVFAGLRGAARIARLLGEEEAMKRYLDRAAELKRAIRAHYFIEGDNRYRIARPEAPGPIIDKIGYQITGWLVWPAQYLRKDSSTLRSQIDFDLGRVSDVLEGRDGWGIYLGKPLIAAATLGNDAQRKRAREAVIVMAEKLATPNSLHFGEVFTVEKQGQELVFGNRTALPHVWEGALFYLAAMAVSDPQPLLAEARELPLADEVDDSGCAIGDRADQASDEPGGAGRAILWTLLPLLLWALAWRRRRG